MTANGNDTPRSEAAARRWFGRSLDQLGGVERNVLKKTFRREPISHDPNELYEVQETFGEHLADKVAEFGGSWTFILIFGVFLICWAGLNIALAREAFDPYPFIFLNLMLSMVAAIQAPVIMMSQNRQADKDRLAAAHDYEVNLKAEIEIMALHEKLDQLRTEQIEAILKQQQEQIALLTRLITAPKA